MEPVTKRVKLDERGAFSSKTIGTHSGIFQASEAMGVWLLRQTETYRYAPLIRSHDVGMLEKLDIVIDVGGIYNHEQRRYDPHHQGYDERFDRGKKKKKNKIDRGRPSTEESPQDSHDEWIPRCTRLSASGLVYRHYGKDVIKAYYPAITPNALDCAHLYIYDQLLEALDAVDTGVEPIATSDDKPVEWRYRDTTTTLVARVGRLNPRWNEVVVDDDDVYDDNIDNIGLNRPDPDERFEEAVALCGQDFMSVMIAIVESEIPAQGFVEEAISKRHELDSSGEIILLPHGEIPWKTHLHRYQEEHSISPLIKFVLYTNPAGRLWTIEAVTVAGTEWENRTPLPEPWRGVRDEDLANVTEIPGARFCHAAGFSAGNDTREGALQMARRALQDLARSREKVVSTDTL